MCSGNNNAENCQFYMQTEAKSFSFFAGCHYGYPPPDHDLRKRDVESEIIESQNLRNFFTDCLANHPVRNKRQFCSVKDLIRMMALFINTCSSKTHFDANSQNNLVFEISRVT